ncbi:hypothetical protein B9Z65_7463 [Elsinoe australis]|uniref:ASST-domain-containing protein n=1 Tax=Elsinoe australis TaxID=40998 RepID=A0A2P7YC88_9PEZI|nr:hypothetical protein B9Z65_7463 [Elsinoe australis]
MGPTVQRCNDTDYITWWSGYTQNNYKHGNWFIYDKHYNLAWNLTAQGNLSTADVHDSYLTPRCTAVMTVYQPVQHDLSRFNISNGWLVDSFFQEIDLATGELLFQWQASHHIDMEEARDWSPAHTNSGYNSSIGWDFFHINSVEKDSSGNYLISARHTSALYYISGFTGSVIWTLGGLNNSFKDLSSGLATSFKYQHMARWVDATHTQISLYDDGNADYTNPRSSRGIILSLDPTARTVSLLHAYPATNNATSVREGSAQVLHDSLSSPDPTVLLGYGNDPGWTEYSLNGTVIWDVALGPTGIDRFSADNYRALKVNFTGAPTWLPRIAVGPRKEYVFDEGEGMFAVRRTGPDGVGRKNDTVYFSWNGATEVRKWVLLAGNATRGLGWEDYVGYVERRGFEESWVVGEETKFVMAVAVDGRDRVLGRTGTLEMKTGVERGRLGRGEEGTRELVALTVGWREFVAARDVSIMVRLSSGYRRVREEVEMSKLAAAGVGGFGVVMMLAVCFVPLWLRCMRGRSGGNYHLVVPRSSGSEEVDTRKHPRANYSDASDKVVG